MTYQDIHTAVRPSTDHDHEPASLHSSIETSKKRSNVPFAVKNNNEHGLAIKLHLVQQ
jgi:hypothetical protein